MKLKDNVCMRILFSSRVRSKKYDSPRQSTSRNRSTNMEKNRNSYQNFNHESVQ